MGKVSGDGYDIEGAGRRGRAWEGHLARLHVANYVAVGVFVVSMYSVIRVWDGALNKMNYFRLAVPFFFVFASMTYLFGFFGISIISSVMDPPFATPGPLSPNTTKQQNSCASTTPVKHTQQTGAAGTECSATYDFENPEVLIVGAGTAGATAAVTLARQGRKVLLVEKCMQEQDRIVGELLQPGGLRALERLGLDTCATEGTDSVIVNGYAIIPAVGENPPDQFGSPLDGSILLYYAETDPEKKGKVLETVEPTPGVEAVSREDAPQGRSFHNCRFVQRLREVAASEPNVRIVEGTVSKLLERQNGEVVGVRYREAEREGVEERATREVQAPLTIVADGIWSGLRKCANTNKPQQLSTSVGVLVTHPAGASPVPHKNCGHVVLAQPAQILIYQISSTETRVLVDVPGPLPSIANGELQRFLREKSAPQLPEVFRPAFLEAVARGDVKSMPNRTMPASIVHREGALLLGDALNMRHPITGGGMTVAIKDVELLCGLLGGVSFADKEAINAVSKRFHKERKAHAATINVLANALYKVFSAPQEAEAKEARANLKAACFDYLSLGGRYAAGPVGLLSGLTPVPWLLAAHFFMVALHGARMHLLPVPTPSRCLRMYRLLRVAVTIIMPQLEAEGSTFLAWWPVKKLAQLVSPWEHERWEN